MEDEKNLYLTSLLHLARSLASLNPAPTDKVRCYAEIIFWCQICYHIFLEKIGNFLQHWCKNIPTVTVLHQSDQLNIVMLIANTNAKLTLPKLGDCYSMTMTPK